MKTSGSLILAIAILYLGFGWDGALAREAFRTWTNQEGTTLEAQLLSADETHARIRVRTGKVYRISLSTLSQPDQDYVAEWRVANDPTSALDATDLGPRLLEPETWKSGELPGEWREVSSTADEVIERLRKPRPVFGERPESVVRHRRGGRLTQVVIVYLEEGNFVGYRGDGATTPEQDEDREPSAEREEVADRKEAFDRRFEELDETLPSILREITGDDGRQLSVGRGDLRKRVIQYASGDLVLNLDQQEGHLVGLTIQLAEDFNRRMLVTDDGIGSRESEVRDNVEVLPNGDSLIRNIPMIEQGSRGYCAMGTLSMITRYYGLNLDIDGLAAAAGYSEGSPQGASITEIYKEAADLGRLRYDEEDEFDFRQVKREVDRGRPVLVWRWFSRPRDAFHLEFAQQFRVEGGAALPEPDDESQVPWPTERDGGHASLITGYNEERGEVFFTESWLNEYRHRRMRIEEMEETAYVLFYFTP